MKTTMVRLSTRLHQKWRDAAICEELSMAAFLRLALMDRVREVLSKYSATEIHEGNDGISGETK
jgi:hypothetical protein